MQDINGFRWQVFTYPVKIHPQSSKKELLDMINSPGYDESSRSRAIEGTACANRETMKSFLKEILAGLREGLVAYINGISAASMVWDWTTTSLLPRIIISHKKHAAPSGMPHVVLLPIY